MASLFRVGRGWRIQFLAPAGERRSVSLPDCDKRHAQQICTYVERLVASSITGAPVERAVALWVDGLSPKLRRKLESVGLVAPAPQQQSPAVPRLGQFIKAYLDGRPDLTWRAKNNLEQAGTWLVRYFGADRPIDKITPAEAIQWRGWLGQHLSDNTIRRHCGRARQYFRHAVLAKLLSENPFGVIKGCSVQPSEKQTFVTAEMTARLLEACPDVEWKVIVGLARLAALRIPSELMPLEWGHIHWEHHTLTVSCPKTRKQGRPFRVVPICPELYTILTEAFEAAEPGSRWIINRYRSSEQNLRTQLQRLCLRAGVPPFPRPFVAMRSSRVTEWVETFPVQCAAEWAGHTPAICQRHYLQLRSEYFRAATQKPVFGAATPRQTPGKVPAEEPAQARGEKMVQYLVQSIAENKGDVQKDITPSGESVPTLLEDAPHFRFSPSSQLPRTGFEPVTPGLGNRCSIL